MNDLIKLTKPDALIIAAQKNLKDKKPSPYFGNAKNIIYTDKGIVRIEVAKDNVSRSLRFMDTFIKLIKQRGHNIKIEGDTYVVIYDESIKVHFREILKRITTKHPKYDWNNSELIPSGILSFKIEGGYDQKEWRDSDKIPLESRLSSILAKLELEAIRIKKERIESEIRHQEYVRKRKIEDERKQLFEKELKDFKNLKHIAKRWQETQDIRNYINTVETNAINTNTLTEELKNYINWAKDKADWYDPIIQKEDPLFEQLNPNKIE